MDMGLGMTGKNIQNLNYLNDENSRDSDQYQEDNDLEDDDNLD